MSLLAPKSGLFPLSFLRRENEILAQILVRRSESAVTAVCVFDESAAGRTGLDCFLRLLMQLMVCAGTLFWMWGYCPDNTNDASLQVSAGDADFKNVISPASLSAVFQAVHDSPLASCTQVLSALTCRCCILFCLMVESPKLIRACQLSWRVSIML